MSIRSMLFAALLVLTATPVLAQSQPQIYALGDDGQTQQVPSTVHHNQPAYDPRSHTYSKPGQSQYSDDGQDDQPTYPPPANRRYAQVRNQINGGQHSAYQLSLVPNTEGSESPSAVTMGVYSDRAQCQRALAGVYDALGAGDPDFYLVCQPHSE